MKDKTAKKVRTHRFEEWALKVAALLGTNGNVTEGIHVALGATPIVLQAIQYLSNKGATDKEANRLALALTPYYWHLTELESTVLPSISIIDRNGLAIPWVGSPEALTKDGSSIPEAARLFSKDLAKTQEALNKHCRDQLIIEQFGIIAAAIDRLKDA
jgi:hypothetical protein